MCIYCERDGFNDYYNVLGKPAVMSLGRLGKASADLELFIPDEDDGKYSLVYSVVLYVGNTTDEYESESVDINYCPFCGRKLSKESE